MTITTPFVVCRGKKLEGVHLSRLTKELEHFPFIDVVFHMKAAVVSAVREDLQVASGSRSHLHCSVQDLRVSFSGHQRLGCPRSGHLPLLPLRATLWLPWS